MIRLILIGIFIYLAIQYLKSKAKLTALDMSTSPVKRISDDVVIIFYAPWCGFCKRSMPHFKEAVEKSGGKITMLSSEEPGTKDLMTKYNIKSFPTIIKGSGEIYKGSRDTNSILEFANGT